MTAGATRERRVLAAFVAAVLGTVLLGLAVERVRPARVPVRSPKESDAARAGAEVAEPATPGRAPVGPPGLVAPAPVLTAAAPAAATVLEPAARRRDVAEALAEQAAIYAPAGDLGWEAGRALVARRRAAEQSLLASLAGLGPGGAAALGEAYVAGATSTRARLLLLHALAAVEDPEAAPVLASLIDHARTEDTAPRREVVAALARRREPAAERALVWLLAGSADPGLRFAAANALAGRTGALALPALAEAMRRDADTTVRREAVRSVGRMGGDAARDLLAALARDRAAGEDLRQVATLELARSFGAEALDALASLLEDPAEMIRKAAVRALARVPGDHALALVSAARSDPSPAVREEAARALASRGAPGRP